MILLMCEDLKLKYEKLACQTLKRLGFSVKKIEESNQKKEADFIISYKGACAFVEAKLKEDDKEVVKNKEKQLEKYGCSIIDNKLGFDNSSSSIFRKALKQLNSSSKDIKDFKILFFLSIGINSKTKADKFKDTIYGSTLISNGLTCYFFNYSEFMRQGNEIDGVIVGYLNDNQTIKLDFCMNPYSVRYDFLKKSILLEPFRNAIIDPFELEKKNQAYIVDKNIHRKLSDIEKMMPSHNHILKHIQEKYNIDEYIVNIDFNSPEITINEKCDINEYLENFTFN